MTTVEERREAARRLRGLRGLDYCKDPRYAVGLASDSIGASHSNGYSWDKMLDRLADLIEPPTQCPYYHSDRHYCSIHDVPTIDRDALLALADEMERMPQCELCPAEIIDCSAHPDGCPDALLDYYARRIREALGVDSGAQLG